MDGRPWPTAERVENLAIQELSSQAGPIRQLRLVSAPPCTTRPTVQPPRSKPA